jgi:hypothetical protein
VRGWQFKLGSAWCGIILLIAFAAYREIELVVTKLKIPFMVWSSFGGREQDKMTEMGHPTVRG